MGLGGSEISLVNYDSDKSLGKKQVVVELSPGEKKIVVPDY